jgi:hypothetical protein
MDSFKYIQLINFLEEYWAVFVSRCGGVAAAAAIVDGLKKDAGLQ